MPDAIAERSSGAAATRTRPFDSAHAADSMTFVSAGDTSVNAAAALVELMMKSRRENSLVLICLFRRYGPAHRAA